MALLLNDQVSGKRSQRKELLDKSTVISQRTKTKQSNEAESFLCAQCFNISSSKFPTDKCIERYCFKISLCWKSSL